MTAGTYAIQPVEGIGRSPYDSTPLDPSADFRALVQSPLRASIARLLHQRPSEAFDIDRLMQTFGCLRQDIEHCLQTLTAFGIVATSVDSPTSFTSVTPGNDVLRRLLTDFLSRKADETDEDRSDAVRAFRELIGNDEKMAVVLEWVRTAAKSDIAVLVLGPTGSGKELVARMIHELSRRRAKRSQTINCAALPDTLFESEIFGYERGAFTGAVDRKPGRLELADGGTLFLDEIGDLSVTAQAKLLRVLEEKRFERLGGNQPLDVDFRLVSATNRPLEQLVREGRFREDLFYRVNAFSIRLPSLRERAGDIALLARRFLARHCVAHELPPDAKTLARDTVERLMSYSWPGNLRELDSTISRAALSTTGPVIRATDLEFLRILEPEGGADVPRLASLRDAERTHVARVLEAVDWNKKQAASILEISRGTLYRKIDEYGLQPGAPIPLPTA